MITAGCRIRINLAFVTVAVLLNMSALCCLEAMDFLKNRKAMGVATLAYAAYTLANCYPRPYTLILGALIFGCGSAVLWSAVRVYISDLATAYTKYNNADVEKTTSNFFATFMGIVALSMFIGTGLSSVVLQSVANRTMTPTKGDDSSSPTALNSTALPYSEVGTYDICGIHNCDDNHKMSSENATDVYVSESDRTVIYVLFAAFAATQIIAALLIFCVLTDARSKVPTDHKALKDMAEQVPMTAHESPATDHQVESPATDHQVVHEPQSTFERIKKQVISTGKFLISNRSAQALIPITIHIGIIQVFALSQLTKHWIACYMGIEFIGYGIAIYGIGATLGSYGSGILSNTTHRWVTYLVALAIEISLGVFLLVWEPTAENEHWVFFLPFGALGMVYASHKTMSCLIYSLFFLKDREAASATLTMWDNFGAAIAYAVSSQICNRTFIIIMLSMGGVGTVLYLLTEREYAKNREKIILANKLDTR